MKLDGTRFGSIEISDDEILSFPRGILGFKDLTRFVLLPHRSSPSVAWLQSVDHPGVALPVVSAHAMEEGYEDGVMQRCMAAVNATDAETVAVLLVMTALPGLPPTVNRRAPVAIDAETRTGAQIVIEGTPLPTRAALTMVPPVAEATAA
ncbi:MAG TPA: flagellar assembly protein FliW [Polyangiaceae bacterium]|nr:flagellar assembly protein FliW [Polyangiaceae bacterium]